MLAPNNAPADSHVASNAMHHGDFDDDEMREMSTFRRIVASGKVPAAVARGARPKAMPAPAGTEHEDATPMFGRSESSLSDQRLQIDQKTMR